MQERRAGPSLGESLTRLAGTVARVVDLETRLAQTEMTQKVSTASKDAVYVAAGGALAYAGFLVLLAGLVNALAAILPRWLATVFVGLVVAAAGGLLVQKGVGELNREGLLPNRTIATLKAGVDKAKEEMS